MHSRAHAVAGFTMIEVLVTIILISGALLGTAGMQSFALKANQSAQFRSEAIVLAVDLVERIEANNSVAFTGGYGGISLPDGKDKKFDCNTNFCAAADMVEWDTKQVEDNLKSQLPDGKIDITWTAPAVGAKTGTYTVKITWTERSYRQKSTTTTGDTVGGKTETFSYTLTRTIYDHAQVI